MNTLSFNELRRIFLRAPEISKALNEVGNIFNSTEAIGIEGLQGGINTALFVSELYKKTGKKILIIAPSEMDVDTLENDFLLSGIPVNKIPWWDSVPYRPVSRGARVFGQRAAGLSVLGADYPSISILTQRAFLTPVPRPEEFLAKLIRLKRAGRIDLDTLSEQLVQWGYYRVPRVQMKGEFVLRGEVFDIFLPGNEYPCRIIFDFDTIESIRYFDPNDQNILEKIDAVDIYPSREKIWNEEAIKRVKHEVKNSELYPIGVEQLIEKLNLSDGFVGEELYYCLSWDKNSSVLDYLGEDGLIIFYEKERLDNAVDIIKREYDSLYRKTRREMAVPAPEKLLLDFNTLVNSYPHKLSLFSLSSTSKNESRIKLNIDPPRSFFGNIKYLKEELEVLIKGKWQIDICAESEPQALRIAELLKEFNLRVASLPVSSGFGLPEIKYLLIHEKEIFGRREKTLRSLKTSHSSVIDSFIELNPGDFVVHVNYGIGLFKGIERIKSLGNERDYIKIEYADEEFVFVPIEQVNLVQRYVGSEGNAPRLDKLGSKNWENRKKRVSKSVEDIAEKLIDLYSKRKAAQGFAFPLDSEWQLNFEAAFPWEETEDQLRCVEEIKNDMEEPRPMDRLVCGDVGYGKTEVALRACFKAVMGGKQVAFLAPTTILAEQHYQNFLERFENFPVKIALISRFVEKSKIKKLLVDLQKGQVDILVGTHRIIQKDVAFKDLGLLVIDEEQRFGVKDKERFKELKANIDCLSLSATPIPRTLHMSLVKIRDMSLLATPPSIRQPIETNIDEFNEEKIAIAIRQETERGGQVFFLHNRIESLDQTRRMIERIVPEMSVEVAHGQMNSQELEGVMRRFVHGGFHVLISTTIIENGIDIPNVNTIIIDRADMYGVSQLYQLRGRVGRSDRKAWAWLFYPRGKALSELAMKRLQVISDFTELGSGFKIALKDMEIRGAGNLLGKEQSGDIYSVGFDLYVRLLEEAVKRLQDEEYQVEAESYLELEYTGFIPNTYIDSAQTKMEVYKKIAGIQSNDELERMFFELANRFGPLPEEVQSLLALAEIRIICKNLSVLNLKERAGLVRIEFNKLAKINVDRLIRLMQESAGRVKLDPKAPNVLILQTGAIGLKEKSEFIREKLAALVR